MNKGHLAEKTTPVEISNRFNISILISFFLLVGCHRLPYSINRQNDGDQLTNTPAPQASSPTPQAVTQIATPEPSSTTTPVEETHTPGPTAFKTLTLTLSPSLTSSPSITPTFAILRGKVLPEHVNCRYGPGASYLYKYGLVGGSNLEIIGRNEMGTWLLIQAIGGTNPCWVKAELMELKGELMTLEPLPPEVIQAWSPYYPPLFGVSAVREYDMVTILWSPLVLRAGDDSEQVPYIVEAWVCQEGKLVFVPVGSYQTNAQVRDEAGCAEPSHGRVLAAEKHGYTWPVEVDWPQPDP